MLRLNFTRVSFSHSYLSSSFSSIFICSSITTRVRSVTLMTLATLETFAIIVLNILLSIFVFPACALVVNTALSYIRPRVFSESPRKDIYEMSFLVVVGKHSITLALSI